MAVGQTAPLDAKEGKKRIYKHWILWGAVPAAIGAVLRESGGAAPDWGWLAAGGILQGGATVLMELREKGKNLQTKGKMAWDVASKLAATAVGWAAFRTWW